MYLKCFIQNKTTRVNRISFSPFSQLRTLLVKRSSSSNKRISDYLILEFNVVNNQWYIKFNNKWLPLNSNKDIYTDSHIISYELGSTQLEQAYPETNKNFSYSSLKKTNLSYVTHAPQKEDKLAFLEQNTYPQFIPLASQHSLPTTYKNKASHPALPHVSPLLSETDAVYSNQHNTQSRLRTLLVKGSHS